MAVFSDYEGLVPGVVPRRMIVGFLAAASVVPWASSARAAWVKGQLSGTEKLLNPVWEEAKEPGNHGYSFREPVPTVPARYRALYGYAPREVCLVALASEAQKPMRAMGVVVGGGRTAPVTLVVPPGTRLDFQNKDPFAHRLYGVGIDAFSAADTAKGAVRQWTVPGPGLFEIRDERAPSLRTWIVGEPRVAALGYPSAKGEFALNVSDPGTYTLQAFFAGKPVGEPRQVTVLDRDIDLSRAPIALGK